MPLPGSHLQVLLALADGERHGYAIMQATQEAGARLGPGALYAALGRLLDAHLIAELDERPAPELDDARRRYYRLTPAGRDALTTELVRLQQVLDRARSAGLHWQPGPLSPGATA